VGKTLKQIDIDFDYSIFLKDKHADEWSVLPYYKRIESEPLPDTYIENNTQINQIFWSKDEVDFDKIGNALGMTVFTVATIKQMPGNILPWHSDNFYKIAEQYPDVDKAKIVRANLFMEDWKIGHVLQIEQNVIANWKKGTGYMWSSGVYHLSGNLGLEDKYTLQVSGLLLD
jgi:hypothetical protein